MVYSRLVNCDLEPVVIVLIASNFWFVFCKCNCFQLVWFKLARPLYTASFYIVSSFIAGLTGLFCPCVLFGRNVERLKEDIPWKHPCICHAICVEGGISLAIATVVATSIFPGIDPGTTCLVCEGLFFTWWMCGIYTGQIRQSLQKKYHLKVHLLKIFFTKTVRRWH